jgi:hypothetical protein
MISDASACDDGTAKTLLCAPPLNLARFGQLRDVYLGMRRIPMIKQSLRPALFAVRLRWYSNIVRCGCGGETTS